MTALSLPGHIDLIGASSELMRYTQAASKSGSIFDDRTTQGDITRGLLSKPELSLPDNQFGPITVFIACGRDGWPIQICVSAPLLLADAKCG